MSKRLLDMVANGIEVVLYTKEENADILQLRQRGIAVICCDSIALHAAIIDKSTIWYGSINILGFHSTDDNFIRFKNAEIASNLLDSLYKTV